MNRQEMLASVAGKTRRGYELLTPFNQKGVKSEAQGYLQAMMYLAPHTLGGGKTICPHSTEACRDACLFTAGRGKTPRVENARLRRTRLYLHEREEFLSALVEELNRLQKLADKEGLKLAIRLNGTSDIRWELEGLYGHTLFEMFPRATFFDYSRIGAEHRRVPENWKLTFSLADQDVAWCAKQLRLGRNVAAIVPDADRIDAPTWFLLGQNTVDVVDGEIHDLRFLDPVPALILLRPKGRLAGRLKDSPMVHPGLIGELIKIGKES